MRAMIRLEMTLDVDTDAGMEVVTRVLQESPGARLYVKNAVCDSIEVAALAFASYPVVVTVNTATARAYVAPGTRRKTANKPRRAVVGGEVINER